MRFDRVASNTRAGVLGRATRWGNQTERFWACVDRSEECWRWLGRDLVGIGYGRVRFDGRRQLAHRVSWQITNGPIPDRFVVCHRCDNPRCVRPEHLFLGTSKDNAMDAERKGRLVHKRGAEHWTQKAPANIPRGEAQPRAKLSAVAVVEIRRRVSAGESQRRVALSAGVSSAAVSAIIRRKLWGHV